MIAFYSNQFKQVYEGGAWFGESFIEKLKDVSEKDAFERPLPDVHSIAELVWHCMYWRTQLVKRLEGDKAYKASMESEGNWLPLEKLKAKGWKKLLQEFEEEHNRLVNLLSRAKDNFLKEEYKDGSTMEYLTEGIIQHDIYHLGQIGLVKKMISLKR